MSDWKPMNIDALAILEHKAKRGAELQIPQAADMLTLIAEVREYRNAAQGQLVIVNAVIKVKEECLEALKFIADLTAEELPYARFGTGSEVALRHANRRATEILAKAGVM